MQEFPDLPSYKIEGSDNYHISEKNQVKGFPQILYFYRGVQIKYQGERTYQDLKNWIKRRLYPEITKEVEESTALRSVADPYLNRKFMLLIGGVSEDFAREIAKIVDNLEIIYRHNYSEIFLYKDFDENKVKYTGEISIYSIKT